MNKEELDLDVIMMKRISNNDTQLRGLLSKTMDIMLTPTPESIEKQQAEWEKAWQEYRYVVQKCLIQHCNSERDKEHYRQIAIRLRKVKRTKI
mgnify:FL=1